MVSVEMDTEAYNLYEAPNQTGTPERNLLMAVIERAILDLVGNEAKEAEQAADWLFGDLNGEKPYTIFSFPWVCEVLELDRFQIANKIRQMPKRGTRRVAPWYFNKDNMSEVA